MKEIDLEELLKKRTKKVDFELDVIQFQQDMCSICLSSFSADND